MKNIIVICLTLLIVSPTFSQSISPDIFKISPSRFSIYKTPEGTFSYSLSGAGDYVEYNKPSFGINVPEAFPEKQSIPYEKLLLSSIYSLLYEYKNYKGQFHLTAYAVFALGNYRQLKDESLKVINETIFPNKKYLQMIYQWVKPYFITTFNSLTFKEQQRLLVKLSMADRYVLNVMKEKNATKYNQWLKERDMSMTINS